MKVGDYVETPRFLTVRIKKVFENMEAARLEGYVEPTHYEDPEYEIQGKHIGTYLMIFAAIKKEQLC